MFYHSQSFNRNFWEPDWEMHVPLSAHRDFGIGIIVLVIS
jgi:hypothetical protein